MKILSTILDAAALIMIALMLYSKFSIRNMVKWENELIAEQKAARNDSGQLKSSEEDIPIYYDDHDVSGLIDED